MTALTEYKTDPIALRKLALDCGISTFTDLADKSGVSRNTIGKVMSGEEQPSAVVMIKLAKCLGMTSTQAGEIFFSVNLRET